MFTQGSIKDLLSPGTRQMIVDGKSLIKIRKILMKKFAVGKKPRVAWKVLNEIVKDIEVENIELRKRIGGLTSLKEEK